MQNICKHCTRLHVQSCEQRTYYSLILYLSSGNSVVQTEGLGSRHQRLVTTSSKGVHQGLQHRFTRVDQVSKGVHQAKVLYYLFNPRANGAKRRSGRKPGARVTNSARLFTPG